MGLWVYTFYDLITEALSRFCDEIRSFHADHGNDLTPGSPAVHEKAVSPRLSGEAVAMKGSTLFSGCRHAVDHHRMGLGDSSPGACGRLAIFFNYPPNRTATLTTPWPRR